MRFFRAGLVVAWLAMLWVSVRAILALGAGAAGDVFLVLGGAFSFAYLVVASLGARGDVRRLLLSDRVRLSLPSYRMISY